MKIRLCNENDRAEVNRLLYQSTVIHSAGVPDFFVPLEESINEKIYADVLGAEDQVLFCADNEDGTLCGVCHLSLRNHSGWVEMKNVHVENIWDYNVTTISRNTFVSILQTRLNSLIPKSSFASKVNTT